MKGILESTLSSTMHTAQRAHAKPKFHGRRFPQNFERELRLAVKVVAVTKGNQRQELRNCPVFLLRWWILRYRRMNILRREWTRLPHNRIYAAMLDS